jgi:O-acetyl-ADP-ribose deacetylase (regulator of RNase III)
MIELRQGDILQADAEALVNTVNCVGVMGRGIALQFRKLYPDNFKAYKNLCDHHQLHPGMIFVHDLNRLQNPRFIFNFPTKRHWKEKSRIEDIEIGLKALVKEIEKHHIQSIAVPPLGCGLGGLNWQEVRPRIEEALANLSNVQVFLYEPSEAPAPKKMVKTNQVPNMTVGRAALIGLMRRYLSAVMDPFVTLLEIHKLMYFMQEAGETLNLKYQKALYGPYAENLRHLLSLIEGHFILGYGDAQDQPDRQIELKRGVSDKAEILLKDHPGTQQHFNRVVDLIEGFETQFGMELLSTVHWVATREEASTPEEAIMKTYAWNDRKKMFTKEHIQLAWDVLNRKNWLVKK